MSDTHRHKNKGRVNRFRKITDREERRLRNKLIKQGWDFSPAYDAALMAHPDPWKEMTYEQQQGVFNYSNPGWWNRLTSLPKMRRDERDKLKTIDLNDERDLIFANGKKPYIYFY